ncbi:hypothetical protein [Streptomyces sp. NBC_01750]|uniref:hypothetical protein n=1 Tax=Streptomyces sp. NBC_01750 TaxID=2975928 RepID=UPI002DD8EE0C|nr:hypothetical protein [Streptomyces sp. NBC_01750]WSD37462.1 hypothetical protein OG966_39550 [Streptomyces sp. NBC_01750]
MTSTVSSRPSVPQLSGWLCPHSGWRRGPVVAALLDGAMRTGGDPVNCRQAVGSGAVAAEAGV